MTTEQNKATASRWFLDIITQGQLAVADEIFAANHIILSKEDNNALKRSDAQ